MKKYLSIIFLTILVIPSVALASWWNPFSWSWFHKTIKEETILIATSTTPIIVTTTNTTTTSVIESEKTINTPIIKTIKTLEPTPAPKTTSTTQNCATIADIIQKDVCYTNLAKTTKDHTVCINITDPEKRNNCYLITANFKKDITICNLIIDGVGKVTKNMCASIVTPNSATHPNLSTDPRAILYTEFMKNPTFENFKTFCNQAKNIDGSQVEKTMDSSRENLITKKRSFYYDIEDCVNYDIEGYHYLPLNSDLLIPLKNSDSDLEREVKLLYNEKVNNLISTSTIRFVLFRGQESIDTPLEWFDFYSSRITNYNSTDENTIIQEAIPELQFKRFSDIIVDLNRNFSYSRLNIK